MDPVRYELTTRSAAHTWRIAAALARTARPGDVIALDGPLGAGKTCFVAGFVEALDGSHRVRVSSPTFTTVNTYDTRPVVYHMDLYRLQDPEELLYLGHEDYVESDGICLIEWWSRAPEVLPADHLDLQFVLRSGTRRRLIIEARGVRSQAWLKDLRQATTGLPDKASS